MNQISLLVLFAVPCAASTVLAALPAEIAVAPIIVEPISTEWTAAIVSILSVIAVFAARMAIALLPLIRQYIEKRFRIDIPAEQERMFDDAVTDLVFAAETRAVDATGKLLRGHAKHQWVVQKASDWVRSSTLPDEFVHRIDEKIAAKFGRNVEALHAGR